MIRVKLDKIAFKRGRDDRLLIAPGRQVVVYEYDTDTEAEGFTTEGGSTEVTYPLVADRNGRYIAWYELRPLDVEDVASGLRSVWMPPASSDPAFSAPLGLNPVKVGPVIQQGGAGAWDQAAVEGPSVWWDEERQRWGAVYVGYSGALTGGFPPSGSLGKIGLAWSDDLVNWTKYASNPILSGSGAEDTLTAMHMVVEDGVYYLFYLAFADTGYEGADGAVVEGVASTATVKLATATDPEGTWTKLGTVMTPSGSGWGGRMLWRPNIVKRRGTYYAFINGTPSGGGSETIGYYTATDLEGPWTKQTQLLSAVQSLADPCVWREGDYWHMAIADATGGNYLKDVLYFTTDEAFPLGWTAHEGGPLIEAGEVWDGRLCAKPFIVRGPGGHYHFHTVANEDETRWEMALAIASHGRIPGAGHPEAVRLLDGAGEPAMHANLDNLGSGFPAAHFYRDANGDVVIGGVVVATGAGVATFQNLFTLPPEYWPKTTKVFYPLKDSTTITRIDISASTGAVGLLGATIAAGSYLVLDGIRFRQ